MHIPPNQTRILAEATGQSLELSFRADEGARDFEVWAAVISCKHGPGTALQHWHELTQPALQDVAHDRVERSEVTYDEYKDLMDQLNRHQIPESLQQLARESYTTWEPEGATRSMKATPDGVQCVATSGPDQDEPAFLCWFAKAGPGGLDIDIGPVRATSG